MKNYFVSLITLIVLSMGCLEFASCNSESRDEKLIRYSTELLSIAESTNIVDASDVSLFLKQITKVEDKLDALQKSAGGVSDADSLTREMLKNTEQEYNRELWRIVAESAEAGIDPYAFHESQSLYSMAKCETEIYAEVQNFESLWNDFIQAKNSSDNAECRNALRDIYGQYGKYIGFLLSERDSEGLLSAVHDKVIASLRREILEKHKKMAIDQFE